MIPTTFRVSLIVLLAASGAWAQERDIVPFTQAMFPAELVMRHQQALGLSDKQRTSIMKEMEHGQQRFLDLRWQLQKEVEIMRGLVHRDRLNEQQILTQLEKVLNIETHIKSIHMALLIRIKNQLTPEQQITLNEIRHRQRTDRPPGALRDRD